jgi:hypothetical protein
MIHPNIAASISGDPNNLCGFVEVGLTGFNDDTDNAYLFLDGDLIGEINNFRDGLKSGIETRSYQNRSHTIKVVTVNSNGTLTMSENVSTCFSNQLFCMNDSDYFDSSSTYYFAVNSNISNPLNVKLMSITNEVQWQDNITGNIFVSIPTNNLSEDLYQIVVEATDADAVLAKKVINKKFTSSTSANVLITLPDPVVNSKCLDAIFQVYKACKAKGHTIKALWGRNCTWANVKSTLSLNTLQYWYNNGHGNYEVKGRAKTWWGGTKLVTIGYRTSIQLWDDSIFSYKRSDFAGIVIPGDYLGDLSPSYETYAKTIGSLNLFNSPKVKFVFVSSCYSARLNDMARALGMYSTNSENNLNQVYLGWKDPAPMSETYNR